MIDKKLLMKSIKAETEELANQRVKLFGKSYLKEHNIVVDDDKKQNKLQKLSNALYEVIDKHYTEAIESNNKTAIIQAETELTLIIEILNEIRTN